jgi:hypothetical protein
MTVRVGVIGIGAIGADHVERFARSVVGSAVSGVFDPVTARDRRRRPRWSERG